MSDEVADDTDFITSLQSHIASLQHRVKELEAVNAKLSLQLANCTCHEKETRLGGSSKCLSNSIEKSRVSESGNSNTIKKKVEDRRQGHITSITYPHGKRYIALKVMYFGKRFYGFASEAQMDPTIESEIFRALEKTRLLVGDKKESQYSRCGRTDKGVSSVGQSDFSSAEIADISHEYDFFGYFSVIALFLRSNIKETCPDHQSPIQMVSNQQYVGEIDYVRVLNRVLPDDIRVLGCSPVPVGFSARFSCLSREYKYFFWEENLDLLAMETAGRKLIGEHDFRNFCKMDALNVHNYRRHITSFEISPCDVRFEGNQLWTIILKGSAFLWHQVRCMVAILFMIGQGFESPNVIDALLDIVKTPRKPQYIMASELPLVLQACYFEDLKFYCSPDAGQALRAHLVKQCQTYQLQAAIFQEALLNCLPISSDQSPINNGVKKNKSTYTPISSRPTEPSYAERRVKLNLRT